MYLGTRERGRVDVVIVPLVGDELRVLEVPHPGMAFDWSRLCAGSLLLAQALLDDATARPNYGRVVRQFQADVVATMPRERFAVTDADIRRWLAMLDGG